MFATLDTTTRALWLGDAAGSASLSDTVGFVRDLPHKLVEAFEATLQEAADADLLERPDGTRVRRVFVSAASGAGLEHLRELLARTVEAHLNARRSPQADGAGSNPGQDSESGEPAPPRNSTHHA